MLLTNNPLLSLLYAMFLEFRYSLHDEDLVNIYCEDFTFHARKERFLLSLKGICTLVHCLVNVG